MKVVLKALLLLSTLLFSSTVVADELINTIENLEKELEATVGFTAYDLKSGERWEYNADKRFAMASTFKVLACAALLKKVELNKELAALEVIVERKDLVSYSPVLDKLDDRTPITLHQLCDATLVHSDNTAANLILEVLGGPQAVTELARSLGDTVTRLDRWETELNESKPGDPCDTTSPRAMLNDLEQLLLGEVLTPKDRAQLRNWMQRTQTAKSLFRAVLPNTWEIADRTGAGGYGTRNYVAVIWPPEREPFIVTVFMTNTQASFAERNAAIRALGEVIREQISN